jgi:excinuclease ABC subunit A
VRLQSRELIDITSQFPELDCLEHLPDGTVLDGDQLSAARPRQRGGEERSRAGEQHHLLRMLYSRAGDYPPGQDMLYAESFSTNTPEGACPRCHGLGRIYEVTERSMVPDDTKTIRERAIAAWPPAWHGQKLRDIVTTLGYDIDKPWRELPRQDRYWLLYTDEQPTVRVYAGWNREEVPAAIRRKESPS